MWLTNGPWFLDVARPRKKDYTSSALQQKNNVWGSKVYAVKPIDHDLSCLDTKIPASRLEYDFSSFLLVLQTRPSAGCDLLLC